MTRSVDIDAGRMTVVELAGWLLIIVVVSRGRVTVEAGMVEMIVDAGMTEI